MEHRCRQGSTDETSVSLRSRPAVGEGGAAVASGPEMMNLSGVYAFEVNGLYTWVLVP
jgi:hypothetical protein